MQLAFDFQQGHGPPPALATPTHQTSLERRQLQGSRRYHAGLAAEDCVVRTYLQQGAAVEARRHRTPEGEIDLVARQGNSLVFVEVKRCKKLPQWDSPVSPAQWRRLERAAMHYLAAHTAKTGNTPFCRFDVAIVSTAGAVTVFQNAALFDT